ncbi:hypothetical protein D3C81_1156180 [compost metagenome]
MTSSSKRFHRALKAGRILQRIIVRNGEISARIGPLKGWNRYRIAPSLANEPFRERWDALQHELRASVAQTVTGTVAQERMQAALHKRAAKPIDRKEGHTYDG